jgi:Co/Zn/Cd efflux system component
LIVQRNSLVGFVVAPPSLSFQGQRAILLRAIFNGVLLLTPSASIFLRVIERCRAIYRSSW